MPDYLLDTGPLIRVLRNSKETKDHLDALHRDGELFISVLTRSEIVAGMRDRERETTFRVLNGLQYLLVDSTIADLAGELMRRHALQGMKLEPTDTVIAATAIHHNLVLVTYNQKDFPMPELRMADVPG